LPTPGIPVSCATSPRSIARINSAGSRPESTASASFGPMPLIENQPLEQILLEPRGEAVQREGVFAHVGVYAERDVCAWFAEVIERRQRHEQIVADAVDVEDDPVRLFIEKTSAQVRNHGR
jgi:hypothetical protein